MRDETYGISVIGFVAGLYGIVAWIGLGQASATGAKTVTFSQTVTTAPMTAQSLNEENPTTVASLR